VTARVLVAGIGNIFLGDDGFGAEVARRLATESLPEWVQVADYGTSGMHLMYDLADGFDTVILIDAAPRGGEPGVVYLLELDPAGRQATQGGAEPGSSVSPFFDAHGMQPDVVLGMLGVLGGQTHRILVVGCEPASTDYGIGLSEPVAAAVDTAVAMVTDLVSASTARPEL
jgi:hydrogenase maturation protease